MVLWIVGTRPPNREKAPEKNAPDRKHKEPSAQTSWSLEKLRAMKRDELVELFKTLEAPPISEMKGEYAAELLDQGESVAQRLCAVLPASRQIRHS